MAVRLCYSPKAYVFTKNSAGHILNITDYVTSGRVQRLVNQASSAEVTLRNPDRRFTKPRKPTFHPMDAITIFLERIRGYPIQVFTGYLDDTPYYQMFPGTVTLQATCTLKRLMYTYFDPSLPYVNSFFASYGWISDQQGAIYNTSALAKGATRVSLSKLATGTVNLQDGSLGKLLYAALQDIGNWDDANIYIEEIPTGENGLAARIAALSQNLLSQEQQAAQELTQFLDQTIGASSQGSGSGSVGSLTGNTNAEKCFNYLSPLLGDIGASGVVGNMMWESGGGNDVALANGSPNSGGGWGIIQWTPKPSSLPDNATLGQQLALVVSELKGTYANVAAQLSAATSPSEAADIYCHGREEPQVAMHGDEQVVNWTQREKNAEAVYSSFHNKTSVGGSTTSSGPRGTSIQNGNGSTIQFTDPNSVTSGTVSKGDKTTAINACINAANAIAAKKYPYAYGGGHPQMGIPSSGTSSESGGPLVTGFDCSGGVAAVLAAARLVPPGKPMGGSGNDAGLCEEMKASGNLVPGPATGTPSIELFDYPNQHIFMRINGRDWGTTNGSNETNATGGEWLSAPGAAPGTPASSIGNAGLVVYHVPTSVLEQTTTYSLGLTGGGSISGPGGSGTGGISNQASAEAFTAELDFPSIQDMSVAIMLGGMGNGLMHDQQLMPFIQQLTDASLRQFQSLPNGDFYAFYPDYFGEFDQHPPYWEIDDLEILNGDIYLNDSALVTHQYVVGDNTYPADSGLYNELFSTGVITIYNAFQSGMGITGGSNDAESSSENSNGNSTANIMSKDEAIEFVKRYGARPQVSQYPMVRSSLYEMFLAYQMFMVAWANQFRTTFNFTFMPEVYPGGKISFPAHGIQMYVQSVTHSWDYTEGFTTDAVLTAPSKLPGTSNPDIPDDMVQALVKPVRDAAQADTTKPSGKTTQSGKHAAKTPPAGAGGY